MNRDDLSAPLRDVASERLRDAARAQGRTSLGDGALALLFRLASDPSRAADALCLLHELQVHQTELGLQFEALQQALADAGAAADARRFELAPVALVAVDAADGMVIRANRHAVAWLCGGAADPGHADALAGRALAPLLLPGDAAAQARLRALLAGERPGDGAAAATWMLPRPLPADPTCCVEVHAAAGPAGDGWLLMLIERSALQ